MQTGLFLKKSTHIHSIIYDTIFIGGLREISGSIIEPLFESKPI